MDQISVRAALRSGKMILVDTGAIIIARIGRRARSAMYKIVRLITLYNDSYRID